MSPGHPADEARRWLQFALADLRLAESVAVDGRHAPHLGCYHAQQSSEKALKAIFVFLQLRFPFTHDLDALRDLLPPGWDVTSQHPDSSALTQAVVESRYSGNWPEATVVDARDAARQARAVWATILDDLERHGLDVSSVR